MQRQVVGAAGLGVCAAHAEAPKGLDADEGAREAVGAVVGDAEGFVEVSGLYDGEDGAEDLLARNPGLTLYLEDGRADEVAALRVARVFAKDAFALLLAHVHVTRHLLELRLAYDGSDVHVGALGAADLERLRLLDDLVQDLVVDVGVQDGPAGSAALLARVAVGALDDIRGGG